MFHQDLHPDAYQNHAPQQLRLEPMGDAASEARPQLIADEAEEEGDDTYHDQRKRELADGGIARAGKRDTDGQGIDARGDGQEQLRAQTTGIKVLLLLRAEALPYHPASDKGQQSEGDPVVVSL